MRAAIFLIALIGCASAGGFLSNLNLGVVGGLSDLEIFWTALGEKMNFNATSIPKCYGPLSAVGYWNWVTAETTLQQYLITSQAAKAAIAGAALAAAQAAISSEYDCMMASEGYAGLNKSMGYDKIPASDLGKFLIVYAQGMAQFNYAEYILVYNLLEKSNFKDAGTQQGVVYYAQGKNVTTMYNQSFCSGISNGVFLYYSIPFPDDLWSCWGEKAAATRAHLINGWVNAATSGSESDAAANTDAFFTNTGNDLIKKIQKNYACEAKTGSYQTLKTTIGYDIHSAEWHTMVQSHIQKDTLSYYLTFKAIKALLDKNTVLLAGREFGSFYNAVAGK